MQLFVNGGTATINLQEAVVQRHCPIHFNGVTNATGIFTGIPAGTGYVWSITDANNCGPATGILDIPEPESITGSASVTTAISCNGGTAEVTLTGSGGTGALSYTFNGVTNPTGIFSDIPAGTGYAWSITDSFNCGPLTGTLDVAEPTAVSGTIASQTNVSVIGGNDGSVTVEGSGGTPPYLYKLDSGSYQVSGTFGSLSAGSYTVTVQDAALCESVVPVSITEPYLPLAGTIISQTDSLCFGENTGSVTVAGAEGVPPYEYSLNGGTYQTSGTFNSLTAGMYDITVRDAVANSINIPFTIAQPAEALSVIADKTNNLCNGDFTGTATATAAGGAAPYEYSWNTTPVQSEATATGLRPGIYTVSVTDAIGCTTSAEVTITEPPALSVNATPSDAACPDSNDGSITLDISGGTEPYSMIWSDGITSRNRTAVLPGNYEVVVTDANGCGKSASAMVGFVGSYGCLVIPQVITPNNDGYNDEWIIRNIDIYPNAEVLIFTRWGKLIYRTRNISADPWDGRSDGRLMPTDSYHYILYLNDGFRTKVRCNKCNKVNRRNMKTRDIGFFRSLLLLIVLSLSFSTISAQQVPMYSQYIMNGYLINPSFAGRDGYSTVTLTTREQWIGLEQNPGTYAASFQTRILKNSYISKSTSVKKKLVRPTKGSRVGLGGYVFNDNNGIMRRTGFQAIYAYHIPMGQDRRLPE